MTRQGNNLRSGSMKTKRMEKIKKSKVMGGEEMRNVEGKKSLKQEEDKPNHLHTSNNSIARYISRVG